MANLEGLQSGVPTRTTATITPTQLRNFEQTYIELTNFRGDQANHAGFVPPSVTHANNYGQYNNPRILNIIKFEVYYFKINA